MGLKRVIAEVMGMRCEGSNRTIVGLKLRSVDVVLEALADGSNRTIVGLKLRKRGLNC